MHIYKTVVVLDENVSRMQSSSFKVHTCSRLQSPHLGLVLDTGVQQPVTSSLSFFFFLAAQSMKPETLFKPLLYGLNNCQYYLGGSVLYLQYNIPPNPILIIEALRLQNPTIDPLWNPLRIPLKEPFGALSLLRSALQARSLAKRELARRRERPHARTPPQRILAFPTHHRQLPAGQTQSQ